ncbi:MAG: Heat shock protein, Metallo peptidase, family [Deltaproteobacteria bacterium]|nr:Heat shock protein, Metallo peptidase, family [Deltaproteobacteria bacterium]
MNTLKTTFLLTALTLLLLFFGKALGGNSGMMFALVMAGVMNFVSYWFSDKIVLKMYGAKEVTEGDAPRLYGITRQLAIKANLPMPKVYIIPGMSPNAFATGRNPQHAAVAATEGILKMLNDEELEGVMAHELAHVGNRDILISSIVATIAGAISMLANMAQFAAMFGGRDRERGGNPMVMIAMAIIAPIAAMLVQMAISRSREYQADEYGARICGKPLALANALKKLHMGVAAIPMEANAATAHMFIVSPLTGGGLMSLFSTHPPMEERVKRLEELSRRIF